MSDRPGRSPVPATAFLVAVVAAVANANFLLAPVVGARVDLDVGVISELSVPGQPGAGWFRLGDGTAGILSTLLAVPLWRSGFPHARFRALCLAVFGLGTLVSAIVPLACAPSLGPCPASAGGPELVHDGVSVVATTAAVVGSLELLWRSRGLLRVLALLTVLASVGTGAVQVWDFLSGGSGGGGLAQRWQVVAVSLWIALEVAGRRSAAGTSP